MARAEVLKESLIMDDIAGEMKHQLYIWNQSKSNFNSLMEEKIKNNIFFYKTNSSVRHNISNLQFFYKTIIKALKICELMQLIVKQISVIGYTSINLIYNQVHSIS